MTDLTKHLLNRHCDMELHRPVLDQEEGVATFYLWNLSGAMVGYQQYRPDAGKRKRIIPKKVDTSQ